MPILVDEDWNGPLLDHVAQLSRPGGSGTRKAAVRALHFWHFPRDMRNMDAASGIASAKVERSTA
jgi:hypothetical protein